MATPKKVDSISLSDTTLGDDALVTTVLNAASLASWLGNVPSASVAVFFQEDASGIQLVLAPVDGNGVPVSSGQFSGSLPCPPYCK